MIELQELRKEFAGSTALAGISLSVAEGEIHGIVGRSGAGKSTLIRCLTGLESATSGHARIDGVDITALSGARLRASRRSIGMVFQHANLLDSRTALENVEHPLQVAGVPRAARRARALELLELVGLTDRAGNHPAQLSGGQQQRVGIARALASEPKILLCDEPTSALDTQTTGQILSLIASLRDRLGITVLIITHEMSVVREICDSATLLEHGRVTQTGMLGEILADPSSPLARDLVPLPRASDDPHRRTLEVALAGTPLGTVFDIAESTGTPISAVESGTLETIDGTQVGRLRLVCADTLQRERLSTALRARGIHVEEAA
ncbi:methionine ABC transporter ATP-binding protein [Brevibacterium yomogidense]|uniref:Methionine ABC transporter ATP-binding protein n=1 Tax=Brevibacterium yomogidense TaxID=946573 RepID=A0A1X6XKU4_9MICO|nr:ATP-binding cassette domain-containing protein [Brevibacterium yomogidense]SLM99750.1 Methionine ABC transporter ATP-binding protein [Brevibacterium yomogidense]